LYSYQRVPEKSIILLHACAHNPTGVDPKVGKSKANNLLFYWPIELFGLARTVARNFEDNEGMTL
jgi:hypothetical protein